MYRTLASCCLSLLLVVSAIGVGGLLPATAHAAEQEKITNPKIGKPLGAAGEAIKKKQWDVAQAKAQEANAVEKKTPFEQFQINEVLGYIAMQEKKYAEAAKYYEENLGSAHLPANQLPDRLKMLVQLNYQLKNYSKASELGDRWLKSGGGDVDIQVLIGQAHYVQKDYKGTISVLQSAIAATQKAGKTPDENWLNLVLSSYFNLDDQAGVNKALEQLVHAYPKPEYWDRLLRKLVRQKNSDRVELNLYRLMHEVKVLKEPDDYMDMTQMLLEAGLPGEAERMMGLGYSTRAFDTQDKAKADRYARLQTAAKNAAAADRKSLPTVEKDAQKSATGQGDVALGLAYASFEQYDKAAEALNRGLQRGAVKDADQGQIMLGISNLKLGRRADAAKAFEQVKADSQLAEIARLWVLYAKSSG